MESERRSELQQPKFEQLPIKLGKVFVSSGAFNASQRIIDWAFVEMPPTQENKDIWSSQLKKQLPHDTTAGIYRHLPQDYGIDSMPYFPGDPPRSIRGFSELKMGEWYFKIGRTTDMTAGICHGTKMILRTSGTKELSGVRTRDDKSGNPHKLSNPVDFISEYLIMSVRAGVTLMQHEEFCQPGDADALVLDANGDVAGLL